MSKATESKALELLDLQMDIMTMRLKAMKKEMEDPDGYVGNVAADIQAINTFMKQNNIGVTADDKKLSSLQSLLVNEGKKEIDDFDVTLDIHKYN